jgi:ribosome-binding protein aMBF1 (putative translation factor)
MTKKDCKIGNKMIWDKKPKCRLCGEKVEDGVVVTKEELKMILCPRCIIAIVAVVEDTLPYMIAALQSRTKAYKTELTAMEAKG